jgi:hypothetical protein
MNIWRTKRFGGMMISYEGHIAGLVEIELARLIHEHSRDSLADVV